MNNAQKMIKYAAIIFAITLIVGIFSSIIMFLTGNIFGSKEGININKYDNNAKILSISVGASSVKIVKGDTLNVSTDNKYVEVKQDNNKVSVMERSHIFGENSDIVVTIPTDMVFDKVYISVSSGTLNIDYLSSFILDIETGAGAVNIDALDIIKEMDIETGAGKLNISGNINNLEAEVGAGEFKFSGTLKGKSKIESGVGKVSVDLIDSISNYNFEIEKGIGSITINNESISNDSYYGNGSNHIEIESGVGSINITTKK